MRDDTFCCGNAKIYGEPSELSAKLDQALRECAQWRAEVACQARSLGDSFVPHENPSASLALSVGKVMKLIGSIATLTAERDDFRKTAHEFNAAVTELQEKLASVTAELDALSQDDGKVERALESKQAECDRLTQQVAATTAAYDRINGSCLGFMGQVASIARFLDCGHCAIDIIAAIKSIRDERDAFTAALAEVHGESKEVQRYHWTCGDAFTDAHGEWCLYTEVKALVDSLQLQEAASRNGFAQAKAREQGLRERLKILTEDRDSWIAANSPGGWIEDFRNRALAAESRAQELQKVCSTARDTLGYLADMHQLSPSDAMHVAELRSALASPPSPPTEHNTLDCEQCWLPHGDPQS